MLIFFTSIFLFLKENSGSFSFASIAKVLGSKEIFILEKFMTLPGSLSSIFPLTVVLSDDVLNPLIEIKNKIKIKTNRKDKNFINFII